MQDIFLPEGCYVLAVSGGVDSVVLLDMLSKKTDLELIVAHFDHGIREDSVSDAEFVKNLALKYHLPFEIRREELGENASEELARDRRYSFLRSVAKKYSAKLVTAHHIDDVIETIAINLSRGTGWRGLAAMDSEFIYRPLIDMEKNEIINYAKDNNLDWREDNTNSDDKYLRNRLRKKLNSINEDKKRQFLALWQNQIYLKQQINDEVEKLIKKTHKYDRYFFINIDTSSALEILRYILDARLTRPQMLRLLNAIKTFMPGKKYLAGGGVEISFTTRNFTIELIK